MSQQYDGFCCNGCQGAYELIHNMRLDQFYGLLPEGRKLSVDEVNPDGNCELYDTEAFQKKFCSSSCENTQTTLHLAIGNMSCYACRWLILEAIKRQFPSVEARLSLSEATLAISFQDGVTKLSNIVRMIRHLGFAVGPYQARSSFRDDLVRLGVSSFCLVNIMLLAIPEYASADFQRDHLIWSLFRIVQAVLCTVVMTFSARPLYSSAIAGIKLRSMHIDQPISLALLSTFLYSLINTWRGHGDIYFDSVSAVVTLLGWGRYAQKKFLAKAEQNIRSTVESAGEFVRREGIDELFPVTKLNAGDLYYSLPGDTIPVHSEIVAGHSMIHCEQITGEPKPVAARFGDQLIAGSLNMSSRLELKALQAGKDSVLGKIDGTLQRILGEKSSLSHFADRMATAFFFAIIAIASSVVILNWHTSVEVACARGIAVLLIACPCAFGLAVPLTMTCCAAQALKKGVVIKSQQAIERLARARYAYFDKTGTLTDSLPTVANVVLNRDAMAVARLTEQELQEVLLDLPALSSHHVLKSISEWVQKNAAIPLHRTSLTHVKETLGEGVEFVTKGHRWRIGRAEFCDVSTSAHCQTYVVCDGHMVAAFGFADTLLENVPSSIEQLRKLNIGVGIISGDQMQSTERIAQQLRVEAVFAQKNPFEKVLPLQTLRTLGQTSIMVGNGFNDSLALASADVGVSMRLANQKAKDAADVYLQTPGISGLATAIRLCRLAQAKVVTSFAFTVLFNMIGLACAAMGFVSPIVAAVAMPISSAIVIYISANQKSWECA